MRESTKTITFTDFAFQYSRGGVFDEANSITVCEPNFDKRAVHSKMSALVADAQVKASQRFSATQSAQADNAEAAPAQAEQDAAETPQEPEHLIAMRMGMGADEYTKFVEYVRQQLTNDRNLAFIGSDLSAPAKDRTPVGEEAWISIAREGGMDAVNKVLSAFIGFFSLAAHRRATNGTNKS